MRLTSWEIPGGLLIRFGQASIIIVLD